MSGPAADAPDAMLAFWAKSARDGDAAPMHSVVHHCLDVAAVSRELLPLFAPPVAVTPAWVAAMVALHDIGKFTRPFQAKVPALWPPCLGACKGELAGWPHDKAGLAMLRSRALRDRLAGLFEPGLLYGRRDPLWRAVAGHHGRPPLADEPSDPPADMACAACLAAAGSFIDALLALLAPPPLALPRRDTRQWAALAWWLAGITTLADWIGSSRTAFPPVEAAAHADLAAYWARVAVPHAKRAVAASGLQAAAWAAGEGMQSLFPDILASSPLQQWVGTVPLPDGPALFVIEDATGSGKTEAALVLGHRLVRAGSGRGLFFALPTMATANGMFGRMQRAYERLLAPGHTASLVLAHGRRMLNPRFTATILDSVPDGGELHETEAAAQRGAAQCAAWIADDRRKAFLAAIAVGTIDQAWLAVLPSRHAMLRLLGLARHVLIVDEAHGYDGYEGEELSRLLEFHAALGGSAIVLSATLTAAQRGKLAAAFRKGRGAPPIPISSADAYPLATIVTEDTIRLEPMTIGEPSERRVRSVAVERVASPDAAADPVAAAAHAGGAVAWIRNAVDDVLAAAALLSARGCTPVLFHARFAMGDRLGIEGEVLRRAGRESTPALRRGFVLLATQVLQESLDCDFDLLVSDLAPADLVIQRAGRLWRHERPPAERAVAGPRLLLHAPAPVADPAASWLGAALRRTGVVYADHALLWRSARALLCAGRIETPGNVRALVEAAYDRTGENAIPPGLAASDISAEGSVAGARACARQNLLAFDDAYAWRPGWEPDYRTPTRLADPTTVLRLARIEAGRAVPWHAGTSDAEAWALSEVSVRAARVASAAPSAADAAVAALKAGWPAWERDREVVVLRPDGAGAWRGAGRDRDGRPVPLAYDPRRGLIIGIEG